MILVTGGCGYIGSHTVVELIKHGYEVLIVDNLSTSTAETIHHLKKITGVSVAFENIDLINKSEVLKLNDKYSFSAVIHFAGHMAVGESMQQPLKYYENNVTGIINLLQLVKLAGCINFIFSSSCTVYGQTNTVPVNESFPLQRPNSPYGNTKKISEEIIEDFAAAQNLKAICLRYFNPIGAHPSGLLGEFPGNVNNLLPVILKVVNGQMNELKIFGNDYPTKDGSCIRDYIHVIDIATAHLNALQRLETEKTQGVEKYNLGTGCGYSVFEIVDAFEKVSQRKIKTSIEKRRDGDVSEIFSDSKLAQEKLHWSPKYSLNDMLSSAWNRAKNLTKNEVL